MPKNRKPKKREKTELNLKYFSICVKCGKAYAVIDSKYCGACSYKQKHRDEILAKHWNKIKSSPNGGNR